MATEMVHKSNEVGGRSSLVVRGFSPGRTSSSALLSTGEQYLEIFAHAGGSDEVFKLKHDFGTLLREPAVFECVRKLVCLADPHQELGLGAQGLNLHAGLRGRSGESSEVDVRGQILLAGGLVGIG